MEKRKITEEEYIADLKEMEEQLDKGKKMSEEMTYREKMEAYAKFVKLYNVKKLPEDRK